MHELISAYWYLVACDAQHWSSVDEHSPVYEASSYALLMLRKACMHTLNTSLSRLTQCCWSAGNAQDEGSHKVKDGTGVE